MYNRERVGPAFHSSCHLEGKSKPPSHEGPIPMFTHANGDGLYSVDTVHQKTWSPNGRLKTEEGFNGHAILCRWGRVDVAI